MLERFVCHVVYFDASAYELRVYELLLLNMHQMRRVLWFIKCAVQGDDERDKR